MAVDIPGAGAEETDLPATECAWSEDVGVNFSCVESRAADGIGGDVAGDGVGGRDGTTSKGNRRNGADTNPKRAPGCNSACVERGMS